MPEVLSDAQIADYNENGCLVVERHLPEDVIDGLRA